MASSHGTAHERPNPGSRKFLRYAGMGGAALVLAFLSFLSFLAFALFRAPVWVAVAVAGGYVVGGQDGLITETFT